MEYLKKSDYSYIVPVCAIEYANHKLRMIDGRLSADEFNIIVDDIRRTVARAESSAIYTADFLIDYIRRVARFR